MTDAERVYSLYVQANPVPDPDLLPSTQDEAELLMIEGSQDMDTQERVEIGRPARAPRRRVAVVAFVAALVVVGAVVGIAALVGDDADSVVAAGDARPEVVFDGESCTYAGPAVIERGRVDFSFVNTNNDAATLVAWRFVAESDLATQLEEIPVGADAAVSESKPGGGMQSLFIETEAGESAASPSDMVAGTYIVDCATMSVEGSPDHVWRAATIEVVVP